LGNTVSNTDAKFFTIYPTNYYSQKHSTKSQFSSGLYNCFNSTATYVFDLSREFPTKDSCSSSKFVSLFNNYVSFSSYLLALIIMNTLIFISLVDAALV
jgi:hypothetical protein